MFTNRKEKLMRGKRAIKNILYSFILQIITLICGFIIPKTIIQNFGSNVNGLVSSIAQFLAYISLLESGVGPVIKAALYKPIAKKDSKEIQNILNASEKFFKTIAGLFVVYLIILCFTYPKFISTEFDTYYTISLIIIIALSTFAEYFFGMTYRLFLQANQKIYVISKIQIITVILNAISVIFLINIGCNIQIVKLASAIIFVLRPIIQNIYVKRKYNINLKEADENYKLEKKWDGLAQHIAAVVHDNTDIAVLSIFSTMTEVSVYSVYLLVIKGIKNLVHAFTGGIDAYFGDIIAKNEKQTLDKSFKVYELFYFSIITIVFVCTMILIVPFVKVYTKGITDVNYIRPLFGFLMVVSEFVYSIRVPYNVVALSAGHFKEIKKGAWIEAGINVIISIILVLKYGIVGVAIGTLIAMIIRTTEFLIYTSKNILNRNIVDGVVKVVIICIEAIIVYIINIIFLNSLNVNTYFDWIIYGIIIATITSIVVLTINYIVYKNEYKEIVKILKNIKKTKKDIE